jgi:ADP-heptose:LPS heptosyltransferase
MPSIAIFRTGGIGDVVLSTVAINILTEAIPGVNIHWFGYSSTTGFIREAFPFAHVYELNRNAGYKANINVVKNIASKPDLVIDLQKSARTMIIGRCAAAHFQCPYITWNKFSIYRTILVIQSALRGRSGKVDIFRKPLPNRYTAMARCVSEGLRKLEVADFARFASYSPDIKTNQRRIPGHIAINLGALYSSKELPYYKLKKIVSHLLTNNITGHIYILGDEKKKPDAEKLIREFIEYNVFENLCGKTTLWDAACILSRCSFAVVNDSALAHLSESVGTPVLMFFGPTTEKFGYSPHLPDSKSFSANLSCRPCTKGGNTNCGYGDFKCLHDIPMEPVFEQISRLHSRAS